MWDTAANNFCYPTQAVQQERNIMNFFQNMSPKLKSTLLKSTVILAFVILIFTFLSKNVISGGETLAEYAQSHSPSPESTGQPADIISDVEGSSDTSVSADADLDKDASVTPEISPERVTYQEGFYYEPLSAEQIAYITGVSYPAEETAEINYEDLSYVHVLHMNFEGSSAEGELICNKAIARDLVEIFYDLYIAQYQIEKITLIENYNGDDTASMRDNNTSCFNFRPVEGTSHLSQHAYGLAIDINPFYNPYITYTANGSEIVSPEGSEIYTDRSSNFPYKIDQSDFCYQLFTEHGFIWGGNWNSCKDYQHFQKALE